MTTVALCGCNHTVLTTLSFTARVDTCVVSRASVCNVAFIAFEKTVGYKLVASHVEKYLARFEKHPVYGDWRPLKTKDKKSFMFHLGELM